jgi:hypothetical protein
MLRQQSRKTECRESPDTVEEVDVLVVSMLSEKRASAVSF